MIPTLLPDGGTPDPNKKRLHRSMGDVFADGAAFVNGTAIAVLLPIAGALLIRLRLLVTGGGSLTFAYVRPPAGQGTPLLAYGAVLPAAPLPVVANVEGSQDITNAAGECYLLVTYTPSAGGVVTFADIMMR